MYMTFSSKYKNAPDKTPVHLDDLRYIDDAQTRHTANIWSLTAESLPELLKLSKCKFVVRKLHMSRAVS